MRFRSLAIGLSLLTAGSVIGVSARQFAAADVSSGDRPVLVSIEPCRIADTRPAPNSVGPTTSPLAQADTMTIDAQQIGTDCTGKIPADASSLALNVTALDATSNSFLTIWAGGDRPNASALNPSAGQRVFNAVTTELASDQTFKIFNNRGSVNVFVDVTGYYENHDHDDRYYTQSDTYTQAEVDELLDRSRIESFTIPAQGMNISEIGPILRVAGGLEWKNDFSGGAAIDMRRPSDWTGTGDVTLRILYERNTTNDGDVEFFARPASVNDGDNIVIPPSIRGSSESVAWDGTGLGGQRVGTITIPASRLINDWWTITIQRNPLTYTDDVVVTSVALEYDAES
jgi:hypothetical protein